MSQSIVITGLRGSGLRSILRELNISPQDKGHSRLGTTDLSTLDLVSIEVQECSHFINNNHNVSSLIYVLDLGDDYIHTLAILYKIMKEIVNQSLKIDVLLHKCDRIPIQQERKVLLKQISDRFPTILGVPKPFFHLSSTLPNENDPTENINWIISNIAFGILKNSWNINGKVSFLFQQKPRICLAYWGILPTPSEFMEASSIIDMIQDIKELFDFSSLGSGKIGEVELKNGKRISYSHFMGSILFSIF